jgi:beta-glucanase (GH16 family)
LDAPRHIPVRALFAAAVLTFALGATGAQAAPPPGTWHGVFADEFNGSSLDTSKWNTCYPSGCFGPSAGELERYQAANVTESGGYLHLTARKDTVTSKRKTTSSYTSGMISSGGVNSKTQPKFSFQYGYFEISAQVPKGQGLWPAFWTQPASYRWPPEIDAMEINGAFTNMVNMTYHWSSNRNGYATEWFDAASDDYAAGQHTFGVDWEPGSITWYVDGVQRFTYTDASRVPNEPLYLIANLAVGGVWPGDPDATTPFPSEMKVDYIRAYQH